MLREDDSFRGYRKGTLDLNGVMILPILLMNDQVKQMSKRNFTLSQSGKPKFGLQELFLVFHSCNNEISVKVLRWCPEDSVFEQLICSFCIWTCSHLKIYMCTIIWLFHLVNIGISRTQLKIYDGAFFAKKSFIVDVRLGSKYAFG